MAKKLEKVRLIESWEKGRESENMRKMGRKVQKVRLTIKMAR